MIPVANVRDFYANVREFYLNISRVVTETGRMIVFTVETNSKHVGLVH